MTMTKIILEEREQLEQVIARAKERMATAPEGFLRIAKKEKDIEYYYKEADCNRRGSANGKYIKKNEIDLARRIAQRDYDVKIAKNAERRIKAIDSFLKEYEETDIKDIYEKMNPYRRELITTNIISDEEYIRQWQAVVYNGKDFTNDMQEIITERGEIVRSKSEKIIADKLYALGIPYRYEYPLILDGNVKIYPDFTILKMPQREEVYLEHFGLMDNSEYVESVLYKLTTYERNGIYPGINLFFTHETSKMPLNTRVLDGMLKELFCERE